MRRPDLERNGSQSQSSGPSPGDLDRLEKALVVRRGVVNLARDAEQPAPAPVHEGDLDAVLGIEALLHGPAVGLAHPLEFRGQRDRGE